MVDVECGGACLGRPMSKSGRPQIDPMMMMKILNTVSVIAMAYTVLFNLKPLRNTRHCANFLVTAYKNNTR